MKTIRTFFWNDRVKSRRKLVWDRYVRRKPWNDFVYGNAGDIFTHHVLAHFYPNTTPENTSNGPRILCVGSTEHKLAAGDVLSGIGCRSANLRPFSGEPIQIHALRGPISYDTFKAAGYDVSQVRFLADPGLLIGLMVPSRPPTKGRVIFIPHYRERKQVFGKVPKAIHLVDIDNPPLRVAREIQRAECVYSSSLHGIIFAHTLGRPCVFVRPATEEPLFKYEDYFLSVGLIPPKPLDAISDANFANTPTSPAILSFDISQVVFPAEAQLQALGIIK